MIEKGKTKSMREMARRLCKLWLTELPADVLDEVHHIPEEDGGGTFTIRECAQRIVNDSGEGDGT